MLDSLYTIENSYIKDSGCLSSVVQFDRYFVLAIRYCSEEQDHLPLWPSQENPEFRSYVAWSQDILAKVSNPMFSR